MSDPMIDPLPPDLMELLEREKRAYPEDDAMKAAVLARVEATIAPRGPGGDDGGGGGDGGPAGGGIPPGGAGQAAVFGTRAVLAISAASFLAGGIVATVAVSPSAWTAPSPTA